ncbi:NUDIX domain-containing protein [Psychrobacillus glaciei]|uniref:NUDIX domain-containing protein n=1 Tax=Psychrobacillus glaciei TaxID=2283160 RepID=A0A5J6SQ14_9BACI|nr:NUDIX domain-containing protein [Psychrobacillus glaciei]QFF99772.1 NUDIX domain-containing protein [Psychrobacillus glaciei]
MLSFRDLHGIRVELAFEKGSLPLEPMHVLVLAKHQNKWLLTKHPKRGIEFPGGKVEENESPIEAIMRETLEETNVAIKNVEWIAEYLVYDETPFCKAVYIANVGHINVEGPSFETEGAVWLTTDEFLHSNNLSFHMKDTGMKAILEKVITLEGKWNG